MFKAVSSKVNLPELEENITKFWKENRIFEKSIEQRSEDNKYTFVDGPPFVSGLPHYGSLLPSVAKDLIPRYQTMLGKRVRRVWGWDCHGLPVEDKVNEKLNIRSSKQLEEYGIEKYVKECRSYVEGVTSEWRWYVEKIGRWVDMDNAYYTMHLDFMESVIWAFKKIYEKGLIYKGKRVSLFSTDTSTPVSGFEVAMDQDNYRDTEDLSVFVKFEVKDLPEFLDTTETNKRKIYLLAWTTTPWTIPSNFALAVNENFDYSLVEYEDELFILARERVGYAFNVTENEIDNNGDSLVKTIKEFKGIKLEGVIYKPVYNFFVDQATESDFRVYLSEDVTSDEGTGVLHVAPAFGEVDFQMGLKYGISSLADIDTEGKMMVGDWQGIYLRDASSLIAEDMEKKGSLLRSRLYTHRLPFYRGKNPLIYMAQDAYFIDIQKLKKRMLELNQDINWIPKHIKNGRFADTIETSPDWCISRNRYWATIMPIWKSEDGDQIVIGSVEEIMGYTDQITKKEVEGKVKYFFGEEPMQLHRDICDKIILKKDGKEYRRVSEVLDCWMDSGSVPFAEYHYPFDNTELFEGSRPADFIVEYTPQVRAWFNVLHRISTILFDDIAFKTAISHGTIAGTDGRKMSKSYGNYPDPKQVLEKYGGDALRLYFMASPVMRGEDMNFSEEGVAENYKFLLILWNCYKFFIDYASIYNWNCNLPGGDGDKKNLTVLDKWILARLTEVVLTVRKSLDSYDIPLATKTLTEFLTNDFSTWYIRRSRDRVGMDAAEIDRNVCLSVMYGVLVGFTKLAAPVIPFITDEMYKNLTGEESVHLADYPLGDKSLLDEDLIADMKKVREIVEKGHAKRKEAEIKLRQPLAGVVYSSNLRLSEDLEKIISDELNVKEVEFRKAEKLEVSLDTKLTPQLEKEGQARDLIRQIQQLRKEANLTLNDRIKVEAPSWPKEFEEIILSQTASDSIQVGESVSIKIK